MSVWPRGRDQASGPGHRRHSRSAFYWDIRPLQVTTITNSRLLCQWKHYNFMQRLNPEHKLSHRSPKKAVHKVKMNRFIKRGWNVLVLYLIREVFPECECDNLIVDDTWGGSAPWQGADGDLGLVTRPSSRWQTSQREEYLNYKTHLGSGIAGMCASRPGQVRLMAHCYHPEERHHSPLSELSLKMTQTMEAKCDDVAIKSSVMSPAVIMT